MDLKERFVSLPISTKRLLGIGLVLALVIALPLFIWAIVTQKFLIIKKAQIVTTPLVIQEPFTGNGLLDSTKWNWSGTLGSNAILENDRLKVSLPAGHDSVGGNDVTVFAYVDSQIPQIAGEFDVSVDVSDIEASGSGTWAALKFAPGIMIRRYKSTTTNKIEVLTSPTNTTYTSIASFDLPESTQTVKLRLLRTQQNIQAFYDLGGGFVLLSTITDQGYVEATDTLPRLVFENDSPDYPSGVVFFDNYFATANMIIQATPTPTATATPTGSPPPTICASVPMSLAIGPIEQTGGLGAVRRYQITVTNNDSAECGSTHTVYLNSTPPTFQGNVYTGWTVNFGVQNFLIGAHDTFTTYADVKSATENYSLGQYSIQINLTSINIPQNSISTNIYYNLTGSGAENLPTQTPAPTPTPEQASIQGEPNSCGGTCGSNYNCKANLYCYQGFCRNPDCPGDITCGCATPTPTPKPISKVTNKTATPIAEVVYLSPMPYKTPIAMTTPRPTETPVVVSTEQQKKPTNTFLLWIAGTSFITAIILFGVSAATKKPKISSF